MLDRSVVVRRYRRINASVTAKLGTVRISNVMECRWLISFAAKPHQSIRHSTDSQARSRTMSAAAQAKKRERRQKVLTKAEAAKTASDDRPVRLSPGRSEQYRWPHSPQGNAGHPDTPQDETFLTASWEDTLQLQRLLPDKTRRQRRARRG